jgi:hypothetical protein
VKVFKLISDICITFTQFSLISLDILHPIAIFCMFLAAYPPNGHTLLWLRKMFIRLRKLRSAPHTLVEAWLHHSPMLALVDHRSNLAAAEFLHTVAHNFVVHLLLVVQKILLLQFFLFYFSLRHEKSFL